MDSNKDLSIKWEKLKLDINDSSLEYPLLVVKIWGSPNLGEIFRFMKQIDKATEDIDKEYISLTDFTNLNVGALLESILSISMSDALKKLIGVRNKSRLSFVLIGKDTKMKRLRRRLESLNKEKIKGNYAYNYVFIESKDELKKRAEELLSN